jgi:hypothetical protein
MRPGRFVVAVFVALCLMLPPIAPDAHAADTAVECGFTSEVRTEGHDGDTAVATYVVGARWCIETTYETRTITEGSSGEEISDGSDQAQADKAKKKQKAKKGRKGKKARKRAARRSKNQTSSRTTTRTERRVVSTCMTDFELDAEPQALVGGVDPIGFTTTPVAGGDACASRAYRIAGRFGRDYIAGVPSETRSVISQEIGGTTVENYPLGRLGHFDVTVTFARDGGARCERCVPAFEFCDVRIVTGDDASCVRL